MRKRASLRERLSQSRWLTTNWVFSTFKFSMLILSNRLSLLILVVLSLLNPNFSEMLSNYDRLCWWMLKRSRAMGQLISNSPLWKVSESSLWALSVSVSFSLQECGSISLQMRRLQSSCLCTEQKSLDSWRQRSMSQHMPSVWKQLQGLYLAGISTFLTGLSYLRVFSLAMKRSRISSILQLWKAQLLAADRMRSRSSMLRWPSLSDSYNAPTIWLRADRTPFFCASVLGDFRFLKRVRYALVTHSSQLLTKTKSFQTLSELDWVFSFLTVRQLCMIDAESCMKPARSQLQSSRFVILWVMISETSDSITRHFQGSGYTFFSSITMYQPSWFKAPSWAIETIRSKMAPSLRPSMKSLAVCQLMMANAILREYLWCLSRMGLSCSQLWLSCSFTSGRFCFRLTWMMFLRMVFCYSKES